MQRKQGERRQFSGYLMLRGELLQQLLESQQRDEPPLTPIPHLLAVNRGSECGLYRSK